MTLRKLELLFRPCFIHNTKIRSAVEGSLISPPFARSLLVLFIAIIYSECERGKCGWPSGYAGYVFEELADYHLDKLEIRCTLCTDV